MINPMASAISTPTPSLLQSSTVPPYIGHKPSTFITAPTSAPHLGFASFPRWILNGRKQFAIVSIPKFSARMRRKGKGRGKGKHREVYASLFGVGAPEILVVGGLALLVFGPKGLAEAARSLGKMIRSSLPAIKELQEGSREFKNSLQREISLDEIDNRFSSSAKPSKSDTESRTNVDPSDQSPKGDGPATKAYTADEYSKVTEAQLKGALDRLQKEQQDQTPPNETPLDGDGLQVPPKPKSDR